MVKTFLRFLQNHLLPLVIDEVEALGAVVAETGVAGDQRQMLRDGVGDDDVV